MAAKQMTDKEKLQKDIEWLSDDSWKKVRKYVDKLKQIERLDAKANGEICRLQWEAEKSGNGNFRKDVDRFTDAIVKIAATYASGETPPPAQPVCAICGLGESRDRWLFPAFGRHMCVECIEYCVSVIQRMMLEGREEKPSWFHRKRFPIGKHQKLWKAIARKSQKIVKEWQDRGGDSVDPLDFLDKFKRGILLISLKEERPVRRYCYCCDYAYNEETREYDCDLCPLKTGYRCIDKDSPFQRMIMALKYGDEDAFKKHALDVAESPFAVFAVPEAEQRPG